ncbi:outer membrane protein [Swaminathania salitolerans LMG 21291]|uniref:Hedgehog/Intein (Hint) domain-containing protein n=2 Tax=Swaminathania salitolerans TaxID=182838 RepID=A0A511BKS9_9PROT|nr:outer membrane protein [Swaminathania salitolerans LMG 21291]GEL00966.1 hypothetical protein SSA02_01290 [Swaminathania salitolerans]
MTTSLTGTWSAVMSNGQLTYTSHIPGGQDVLVTGSVTLDGASLIITGGATVSGLTGTSASITIQSGGTLAESTISGGSLVVSSGGATIHNSYTGASLDKIFSAHIEAGGSSVADSFTYTGSFQSSWGPVFTVESGASILEPHFGSGSFVYISSGATVSGVTADPGVTGINIATAYGDAVPSNAPSAPGYALTLSGIWDARVVSGATVFVNRADSTQVVTPPAGGVRFTAGALVVQSGAVVSDVYIDGTTNAQIVVEDGGEVRNSFFTGPAMINPGGLSVSNVFAGSVTIQQGAVSQSDLYLGYAQTTFNRIDGTAIDPIIGTGDTASGVWVASTGKIVNPSIGAGSNASIQGGMDPSCFLPGSLIRTIDGYRAVETLKPGDTLPVFDGGIDAVAVVEHVTKMRFRVDTRLSGDRAGYPVRVHRHAFAENCPFEDLLVTPEHCFLLEGRFVPVRMLVNGGSIRYETDIAEYDYYHVSCADHHVIDANGVRTESHFDETERSEERSHPHGLERDTSRVFVEPIWQALRERSLQLGLVADAEKRGRVTTRQMPCLIDRKGQVHRARRVNGRRHIFHIDGSLAPLRLRVGTARPCDVEGPFVDDRRELGVLVGQIMQFDSSGVRPVTGHHERQTLEGWHDVESPEMRWTRGLALLPCHRSEKPETTILSIEILDEGPARSCAGREEAEQEDAGTLHVA